MTAISTRPNTAPSPASKQHPPSSHPWAVLLAASTAMFAVQLDFFALQSAIPQMAKDLDTPASDLQWVISGYMLAEAAFLIAGGRLADIFGRKRFLIAGAIIFGLSSLIGGAATSPEMLIAMRLVQGIGAATMLPVCLAVTTNAFPAERVQRAVGLVFAIGSVGLAFGPLVGGVLTDLLSWRIVLWINVPVTVALVGLALYGVEDSRDETVPRSVDIAGLILVIAAIAAFTFGIDRTTEWGWLYGPTLLFVFGGLIGLALFVLVEKRVRYPLLDLSLFQIRVFSVMAIAGSVGNGATTIVIFLTMIFLQDVQGFSPIEAGMAFLTFSLGYAVAGLISGRVDKFPPWIVMACGLALGGLSTIGIGLTPDLTAFVAFAGLAGLGLGFVWAYTSVVTQSVVPKEKAGAASGTVLTVLISLGAVALAVAVSIYEAATSPGSANQAQVIKAILTGAGTAVLIAAAFVATFGRDRGERTR